MHSDLRMLAAGRLLPLCCSTPLSTGNAIWMLAGHYNTFVGYTNEIH